MHNQNCQNSQNSQNSQNAKPTKTIGLTKAQAIEVLKSFVAEKRTSQSGSQPNYKATKDDAMFKMACATNKFISHPTVAIKTDAQIAAQMADLILENHYSGLATSREDLERSGFLPGEIDELYPAVKIIVVTALRKIEQRGCLPNRIYGRVKAGSSRNVN